jgi:hypothetical protein
MKTQTTIALFVLVLCISTSFVSSQRRSKTPRTRKEPAFNEGSVTNAFQEIIRFCTPKENKAQCLELWNSVTEEQWAGNAQNVTEAPVGNEQDTTVQPPTLFQDRATGLVGNTQETATPERVGNTQETATLTPELTVGQAATNNRKLVNILIGINQILEGANQLSRNIANNNAGANAAIGQITNGLSQLNLAARENGSTTINRSLGQISLILSNIRAAIAVVPANDQAAIRTAVTPGLSLLLPELNTVIAAVSP